MKLEGGSLLRNRSVTASCELGLKEITEAYGYLPGLSIFHNAHAKLFRSSFKVRFPEVFFCEDSAFFLIYFLKAGEKVYYLNKQILNLFKREGSTTRSRYRPEFFDGIVEAYKIIIDLVNDEEYKRLMTICRNQYIYLTLMDAIKQGVSSKEIKRMKLSIRPSAQFSLKCREYPIQSRIRFFIAVFAPVPVYKAAAFLWDSLRALRKKHKSSSEEVITNWQDFPKAPGIPV